MTDLGSATVASLVPLTAGTSPNFSSADCYDGGSYFVMFWSITPEVAGDVSLVASGAPNEGDTDLEVYLWDDESLTDEDYYSALLVDYAYDGIDSELTFSADAGQTYLVALYIYETEFDTYHLTASLPVAMSPIFGRRRTGYALTIVDSDVSSPPANVPPHSKARAITLPEVTYDNGRAVPVVPTIATEDRLRTRIVIDRQDVTYFRGVETRCDDFELLQPFGWGSATIQLPQVNPGETPPAWVRKGANVRIDLVDPADNSVVSRGHYRGFVTRIDTNGSSLALAVDGDLAGRAAITHRPPALFERRRDLGRFVYAAVRSLRLPFTPRYGPTTDITISNRSAGGGQDTLAWLSWLCQMAQTGTTQYTVMPLADGTRRYELRAKDFDTVAGTIWYGAPGVRVSLVDDVTEQPNRFYGNGIHPKTGQRWLNGVYPGIQPAAAPDYPFLDERSFNVGTTDEDTDTGDGITVLTLKLSGTGFLDREDVGSVYTADVADAVEDLRERAGIPAGDWVNPNVWDALFDIGTTGYTLAGSKVLPLVQATETRRYDYTANGSVAGLNPDYDPDVLPVDRSIDFGVIRRRTARRWAKRELARAAGTNLVGEITLETDLAAGDHTHGDPITILQATSLKPGTNIRLRGYQGSDPLLHVAYVRRAGNTVTLGVDSQARDALHIGQLIERNRESRANPAREWIRTHRRSTSAPDALIGWAEIGGEVYTRQTLTGNRWNIIPVVAGQEGTIARLRIKLVNNEAKFVVGVFGFRVRRADLAAKIGNPFHTNDDGESKWTSPGVQDWLHDKKLLLYAAGDANQPCGYWPRSRLNDEGEESGAPITGIWRDDASFSYRTFADPVLFLAIYPDRNCVLKPQRVFWPQMDDGI